MDIVVAMKQIPDLQQVRIKNKQAILEDVPLTFGDMDKRALEAAVQLKEAQEGTIHLVSVGSEDLEDTVSEALAAGADQATLYADDAYADLQSSQTAFLLADALGKLENFDIVIFGESSGDNYSGQVPSRVAQLLDIPLVGYASSIAAKDGAFEIVSSYEDHSETVSVEGPIVVSVVSEIAEARIPGISAIMKAGRKPKDIFDSSGVEAEVPASSVNVLDLQALENERKCIALGSVEALVDALKAENTL